MLSVNKYFDGKVQSIAFSGQQRAATVGVMDVGDYVFNTSTHEVMTVIDGRLKVKLADESQYTEYKNGEVFEVTANSSFSVIAAAQTAYHCSYQ